MRARGSAGLAGLMLMTCAFTALAGASFAQERSLPENAALLLNGKPDYGTYEAEVVEVIDADTLKLHIHLWPNHVVTMNVRSRGVDAPEIREARCEAERRAGLEAKRSIQTKFPPGSWVYLNGVALDKYGDRIVAEIDRRTAQRFESVTEELLKYEGRWGVPYDGRGPRHDWCADEFGEPE